MSVLATFSALLLAERSMPEEDAWWTGTAGGDNKSGVWDACDCAGLLGCARPVSYTHLTLPTIYSV